ncbi:MAG: hypothetical protein ACYCYI_05630 [Saccharofermentanales bacterium]
MITTRIITESDIPIWIKLSHEYDQYVKEMTSDLSHWYDGNETDIAFADYMKAKIRKKEAVIVLKDDVCAGIVAYSKSNNRITFFAVSHSFNFESIGIELLEYALKELDENKSITINVIKSKADIIEKHRKLLCEYLFFYIANDFENGVPVDKFERKNNK